LFVFALLKAIPKPFTRCHHKNRTVHAAIAVHGAIVRKGSDAVESKATTGSGIGHRNKRAVSRRDKHKVHQLPAQQRVTSEIAVEGGLAADALASGILV
jgi:hypothetical protein